MKYKTYKELLDAYNSGELSRENILYLDNDGSHVYVGDECVFSGNGYDDLETLADLCGFPCSWV